MDDDGGDAGTADVGIGDGGMVVGDADKYSIDNHEKFPYTINMQ